MQCIELNLVHVSFMAYPCRGLRIENWELRDECVDVDAGSISTPPTSFHPISHEQIFISIIIALTLLFLVRLLLQKGYSILNAPSCLVYRQSCASCIMHNDWSLLFFLFHMYCVCIISISRCFNLNSSREQRIARIASLQIHSINHEITKRIIPTKIHMYAEEQIVNSL